MDFKKYLKKISTILKSKYCLSSFVTSIFIFAFFFANTPEVYAAFSWSDLNPLNAVGKLAKFAGDQTFGRVFEFITWISFYVSGLIASLGGQFLDYAIRFALDSNNFKLGGIQVGWQILRDIANMMFIFILLYVGIMTILKGSSFGTKRIISNLILVGLFLNFSLFFTGFVIDVGNVSAGLVYNSMTPNVTDVKTGIVTRTGLGGRLTEGLKLSHILDQNDAEKLSHMKKGIMYLFNSIFLLIAGFVFFAGAFLFIIRHVALILILILSAPALASLILPQTKKLWNKWFGTLISNTFVAPIYLLMIAIVLAIINTSGTDSLFTATETLGNNMLGDSATLPDTESGFLGLSGIMLNYIILIGLLIAALTVSKEIAGKLAGASTTWAGKAIGMGVSGSGFVGRNTLGRGFNTLRQREDLQRAAATKKGITGFAARQTMKLSNYGAQASFDARAGVVGKAVGGTVGTAIGVGGVKVGVGKAGGKGGRKKRVEDITKKETAFAKSLGIEKVSVADAGKKAITAADSLKRTEGYLEQQKKILAAGDSTNMPSYRRATMEKEIKGLEQQLISKKKVSEQAQKTYKTARETGGKSMAQVYAESVKEKGFMSTLRVKKLNEQISKDVVKNVTKSKDKQAIEDFQKFQADEAKKTAGESIEETTPKKNDTGESKESSI